MQRIEKGLYVDADAVMGNPQKSATGPVNFLRLMQGTVAKINAAGRITDAVLHRTLDTTH